MYIHSTYCFKQFLLTFVCSIFIFQQNIEAQSNFIENKGQMPSMVQFNRMFKGGMAYYKNNGITILVKDGKTLDSVWHQYHQFKKLNNPITVKYHRFDLEFVNSQTSAIKGFNKSKTKYHFYKGNDKSKWGLNAGSFSRIVYENLYSKIDYEVIGYGDAIKSNYILKPYASIEQIKINYLYTSGVSVSEGNLIIKTSVGQLVEQQPFAFQIINEDTVKVNCKYKLIKKGDAYLIGFETGAYDKSKTLIIDPILVFSTYSGSEGDNFGFTSTYDSKSHLYAGGIVDGGTGTNGGPFPVTPGAFQTTYSGGIGQAPANLPCDIGINKYDSAGTTLLYSTYLGGSRDEYPHSLVVDNHDNLLVMGTCYSPDFPMDTVGFDLTFNGNTDIFILKLKEDGSDLMGSTFIGGADFDGLNTRSLRYNYADDFRGDIVVDTSDNVYVASTTNSVDFPVFNGFQMSRASVQDGCVFSLDKSLRSLRFSTYIGGNTDDAMYSIRLYDTFVYVGGGTASAAMAFAVSGHKNSYQGGRADGFVAKMNLKGKLIASTYFGTNAYDQIYFLDIDANGQVYAAGQTEGVLTRTNGTYGKDKTSQFIVRFSPNIAVINLTTTFGNRTQNPEISPSAFLVDKCDNIYFSGWGSPITDGVLHPLTTKDLQVTSDAIQNTTDQADFYLLVLNKNATNLLFATYFGGNRTEDHVDGGTSRFDKKGVVYQSVCSSCPDPNQHFDDFPVSPGAPFKLNKSPRCSNASFKIDFQINYEVDAKFTADPTSGCEPLKVTFTNNSKKARQYFWDFGDGSKDTARSPVHTYLSKGIYKVKLTTVDSFSCNISESDSTLIEVKENPKADFEFTSEACSREFKFKNKSENYTSPIWDFGDSTANSTDENPTHVFEKNGEFKTILKVKHPVSGCIDTQSVVIKLYDDPLSSLKIPNVFSPNSDNSNDCYNVGGVTPNCDELEIFIYDRWGVLVFEGVLPNQCWNGKLRNTGEELPSGVYYYILKLDSKNPKIKGKQKIEGVIHLIR